LALTLSFIVATTASCVQSSKCGFTFVDTHRKHNFAFDFSSMCRSDDDYAFADGVGHSYYANMCRTTQHYCLPVTWQNQYMYGVAEQFWGAPPAACTSGGATPCCDSTGVITASGRTGTVCCDKVGGSQGKVACTQDCQVIGLTEPTFEIMDESNPTSGGVMIHHVGTRPKEDDPFWCDFDPATGQQYERKVTYNIACDKSATTPITGGATQNLTNDCHYQLAFTSRNACGDELSGSSVSAGGWIFLGIIFFAALLYVAIGVAVNKIVYKVWDFPNRAFWIYVFGLVVDGVLFIFRGFKKNPGGSSAGGYSGFEGGDSSSSGGGSASYGGSSDGYQDPAKGVDDSREAYTDL